MSPSPTMESEAPAPPMLSQRSSASHSPSRRDLFGSPWTDLLLGVETHEMGRRESLASIISRTPDEVMIYDALSEAEVGDLRGRFLLRK